MINTWSRLKPLANTLINKVGFGQDLENASIETAVLQFQETERHVPPIFLRDQLGKAKRGASRHHDLGTELEYACRTELIHMPVVRYTLENCLVHPAGVDFIGGSYRIQPLKATRLVTGHIRQVQKAIYCMTAVTQTFFGHWLQDACPTALLRRNGESLLLDNRPDWPHCGQYIQGFGLQPEKWELLYVNQLTLYQDHSQGSSKRQRYAVLRKRLEDAYPEPTLGRPRVYFRRGKSGVARLIANEEEVIRNLKLRGFEVFDLIGASVSEIITRFRFAEFVVSVDGSHLNHLYFTMQPGAKLLTFIPADCFTLTQVGYCAASGLGYGFIVIDPVTGGYNVSLPDLHATLDLMGI